jgi:hypothetical protein
MDDGNLAAQRVVLYLEPSQDSIRGSMSADDGLRRFEGWLDLSALLDEVRPRATPNAPSTQELTLETGEDVHPRDPSARE